MTAQAEGAQAPAGRTGVYVYGILPAGIVVEPGAAGVGDPPGEVRAVRHGELAALVSDVPLDRPFGRPADLIAHEELLDANAAEVPVLPLRFGSVMASDEVVTRDLLGPHHDDFAAALGELDGHSQYIVRGRYDEGAVLGEILVESRQASRLRDAIMDSDPDTSCEQRIELGEMVNEAIDAKREADTRLLGKVLTAKVTASRLRPPTHVFDAVHAAFLVENDQAGQLREAVDKLAGRWQGRIELRLIGPLAAYDFVESVAPVAEPRAGSGWGDSCT